MKKICWMRIRVLVVLLTLIFSGGILGCSDDKTYLSDLYEVESAINDYQYDRALSLLAKMDQKRIEVRSLMSDAYAGKANLDMLRYLDIMEDFDENDSNVELIGKVLSSDGSGLITRADVARKREFLTLAVDALTAIDDVTEVSPKDDRQEADPTPRSLSAAEAKIEQFGDDLKAYVTDWILDSDKIRRVLTTDQQVKLSVFSLAQSLMMIADLIFEDYPELQQIELTEKGIRTLYAGRYASSFFNRVDMVKLTEHLQEVTKDVQIIVLAVNSFLEDSQRDRNDIKDRLLIYLADIDNLKSDGVIDREELISFIDGL